MARRAGDDAWEEVVDRDSEQVNRRLDALGVPRNVGECVRIGAVKSDFTSKAYPLWWAGAVFYAETNAALRVMLANIRWSLDDEDNIPRIISPDGSVVITAIRGNEYTGLAGPQHRERLSTKRPRRTAGQRIV